MRLVRVVLDHIPPDRTPSPPDQRITVQLVLDAQDRLDHHSGVAFGFYGSLRMPEIYPFVVQDGELRFSANDEADVSWNLQDHPIRIGEFVTTVDDGEELTYEIVELAELMRQA